MFSSAPVIFRYTRADAIADGMLVDVTSTARELGFKVPVALTRAAWDLCVKVPKGCESSQDESGRLWDVLWMMRCAAKGSQESEILFGFHCVLAPQFEDVMPPLVTLKAICGPGDTADPVVTVMLPEES